MELFNTQNEWISQKFKGVILPEGLVSNVEFNDCSFIKCSLRETTFLEGKFSECTFQACDLSLANLKGSTFIHNRFEDSQLVGINWTETSWAKNKFLKPVDFFACVINHSTFSALDLKKIAITRCTARDVDFSEANLSGADCRFSDFSSSRFLHTNLTGADFSGATNYSIIPGLNTLKDARFSLPEAMALLEGLEIVLTDYQSPPFP